MGSLRAGYGECPCRTASAAGRYANRTSHERSPSAALSPTSPRSITTAMNASAAAPSPLRDAGRRVSDHDPETSAADLIRTDDGSEPGTHGAAEGLVGTHPSAGCPSRPT